jgi:formylglycine-generating enzyme required for sulfatase activity
MTAGETLTLTAVVSSGSLAGWLTGCTPSPTVCIHGGVKAIMTAVNEDGTIRSFTPLEEGTYQITATATGGVSAQAVITVHPAPPPVVVTITPQEANVLPDQIQTFAATASSGKVTWSVNPAENATLTVKDFAAEFSAGAPGTYNVVATSTEDEDRKALAVVEVGQVSQKVDVDSGAGVSMTMKKVEKGSFQMGCNKDELHVVSPGWSCNVNANVVHPVTLTRDFYIGETEVTQAQWYAVMGVTDPPKHQAVPCTSGLELGTGDDYPMYCVSWNEVQDFITKLNARTGRTFRLPTEAEWEYAARGGRQNQGYVFAGSNDVDAVAWHLGNAPASGEPGYGAQKVKGKAPNQLGLYDMSGNVREWVQDRYGSSYYSNSPEIDPQGPETGNSRISRGGTFSQSFTYADVANRSSRALTANLVPTIGFRLVLDQ